MKGAIRVLAVFGWLACAAAGVGAQEKYPSRPIDFICTWGTGGGADAMARQIGSLSQPLLGVALPVSNVPGAAGNTGMALKHFVTKDMDRDVKQALETLQAQGLVFGACGNTMKGLNVTLDQLADGARPLPQGGVVRVMELQERGFAYIRP